MSTPPASSSPTFISPLATKLAQFLAQKHAMGYRYRVEGYALRELDCFLNTHLSPEDPLITLEIVHGYLARRGTESESNRAHRLTLMREVCRFVRLEDARTVVPDGRPCELCAGNLCRACSAETKANVSCKLPSNWREERHRQCETQFSALPCAFCILPDCGPGSF